MLDFFFLQGGDVHRRGGGQLVHQPVDDGHRQRGASGEAELKFFITALLDHSFSEPSKQISSGA